MAKNNINDLTDAEKLCLAGYALNGDIETAYRISRRNYNPGEPDAKNHRRLALRWVREPACKAYLNYITNATPTTDPDDANDTEDKKFREKEAIIEEMERLIPTLSGTDRLQALVKLADLQNMKKEDVTVEDERVHYYLPLTLKKCAVCTFRNRLEDLNPGLKFDEKNTDEIDT
jgi:hypothetical protein